MYWYSIIKKIEAIKLNFQFDIQQSIQISVKGIAIQLIDEAISECKSEDLKHHEIIHSVRKSCKRIRGLLRIVRPNLGSTFVEENNFFRDLGGTLSLVRDKQVLIELLEYYGKATDNTSFTIDLFMEGDKSINTKKLIENFEQKIVLRKDNINKWEVKLDGFNSLKKELRKLIAKVETRWKRPMVPPLLKIIMNGERKQNTIIFT